MRQLKAKKKEMTFQDRMSQRMEQVDDVLLAFIPIETESPSAVVEAVRYSLCAGGKRVRPIIMKEVCDMCGGADIAALSPFMAAIEMIHTYSLVHDDLPAMDDDDYRRGRLTTHKRYGEAMGILAGDAILNLAYETMIHAFDSEAAPERIAEAARVLSSKAGMRGMVGGQVVDIETNGRFPNEDTLLYMYRTKTAALFEAAFMVGGILADSSPEEVGLLETVGCNLGMAFQIRDDILDVEGDEKKLGKQTRSDEKNKKFTYVSMHGVDKAREEVQSYTDEALSCLEAFPGEKRFLRELCAWMAGRDL